tara:strand:- start:409 stop:777 length:369 start_codon:yes stop_codon:yes gene_type:complete
MSNSIELQGRIKEISDTQTIKTANGDLEKRVLTLILGGETQYPVDYPVEAIGQKSGLFANYKANDEVKVGVNLRSYTDRNGELRTANANAWRITYADGKIAGQKDHADKVENFVNEGDGLTF